MWIDATALRPAALTPPVSKSDAQRALVLGWIAGRSPALHADDPRDVSVLARGLAALSSGPSRHIDCEDGGTPLRFLLALAAITPGVTELTGSRRLGEREHGPLLAALGPGIARTGVWPIRVTGSDRRGSDPVFSVDPRASSQFVSALLLASAALSRREGRPWRVALSGATASAGYLDLTLRWLAAAGYAVSPDLAVSWVADRPLPAPPRDWSGAAYLLAIAWRSGATVAVDPDVAHPDRAILEVFAQTGISWRRTADGIALAGEPTRGADVSGDDCPDLLLTVAALAPALPGPTVLRRAGILRGKESDRLDALIRLVRAAGATVSGDAERLEITPGSAPASLAVSVAGDHRMAMSAAVLAAVTGARVALDDPTVVAKSFPGFWTEIARAGVALVFYGTAPSRL